MSYGCERQRSGEETLVHRQDPQPLSSFVSLVEPKPFERSPVAPQTEFNSLESVGGYKGKGTWGLRGKPGGLQRSGGFVHCSGLESQELSPRRREGPEARVQAAVARAALARRDCLEGVGAGWMGRGLAPGLVAFAGGRGRGGRADRGSRSSWEREINECVDALPFY